MRSINSAGLKLIQEFEGCRLIPYDDLDPDRVLKPGDKLKGTLTVGYGHTGPDVKIGEAITQGRAENLLSDDLDEAEIGVEDLTVPPLSGNEFAALVSLAYNIGLGNFGKSTLLKKLNAGDKLGASQEFARWNKSKGKVLAGLTRRRAAEAALFLKPDDPQPAAGKPTETPNGVEAKAKKRSPVDIALGAAPVVGAAFAGWDWRVLVALVVIAGGIAFWLIRRGRA